MKYGIYYAYWEHEWDADFLPYIARVKKLGFEVLEVATACFAQKPDAYFLALKEVAARSNILLTGGYGPDPAHNIASSDAQMVQETMRFYREMFRKMQLAGIHKLGGGLYGYWPVDYTKPFDKQADRKNSIRAMRELADLADAYEIVLNMEVINRFEGYLLNTCEEGVAYVDAVNRKNVKVMLDTFHMNIEEDSITQAILLAGKRLGHFHAGEANRCPPNGRERIDWPEIGRALAQIGYQGDVVMEPFVLQGGRVGTDIRLWRDMMPIADAATLDAEAQKSVAYLRGAFEQNV